MASCSLKRSARFLQRPQDPNLPFCHLHFVEPLFFIDRLNSGFALSTTQRQHPRPCQRKAGRKKHYHVKANRNEGAHREKTQFKWDQHLALLRSIARAPEFPGTAAKRCFSYW